MMTEMLFQAWFPPKVTTRDDCDDVSCDDNDDVNGDDKHFG